MAGDTVEARWEYALDATDLNFSFVVGNGIEAVWPTPEVPGDLDFDSMSISVNSRRYNGLLTDLVWTFSSLDFGPGIVISGISVETNWDGWSADFVTYGDDFIQVDFLNDVRLEPDRDFWVLSIDTIPEPSSAILCGLALACCASRVAPTVASE